MPLNLAFLGTDSADEIIKKSNYSHYILSGHSLGGAMAAKYSSNHDVDGLVLLAAYPTDELKIPVLSIYGSEDKILNLKTYNNSKSLIKGNFTEDIIKGANHGQFGNFGFLKGDGNATINSTVQQNKTVNDITNFLNHGISNI